MEANNKKINRKRKRKLRKIWKHTLSALSCLVVFCTTYALILPAITAETKTYCGKEEHTHTENCYRSDELLCDLEESEGTESHHHNDNCYEVKKELICTTPESEEHTHGEKCYKEEKVLTCTKAESDGEKGHEHSINCYRSDDPLCEKEEHVHDRMCYSNQDLKEKEEDWKKTLPKNLDKLETLNEKLAAIAYSQKGYEEVKENYIEDEETKDLKYYTRYGEWYGKPYEDWNIMFTSFVLRYAGINQTEIPWGQDWDEWVKLLSKKELVLDNTYEPINGDIVLLKDKEDEKNPDKEINVYSGFVYGKEEEKDKVTYKAIIGDFNDKVEEVLLKEKDYEVLGYIHPEDENKKDEENTEDTTDKDEGNKEENPDEEDEEDQPSEDDLLKPEEPEKIEYQLPEYFLYENEDFTLKLTPIINGKDTMGEDLIAEGKVVEAENDEDSENLDNNGLFAQENNSDALVIEENINEKLDKELSLSEEELKNIIQNNKKNEQNSNKLPIPSLVVTKIDANKDSKIRNLKEDRLGQIDKNQLIDLSYYKLNFFIDNEEIDLKNQAFNAELIPTEPFVEKYKSSNEYINAAPEAEVGTVISALSSSSENISNLAYSEKSNSIVINENYNYSALTFSAFAEDPIEILLDKTPNPEFSVEIYGKLFKKEEATFEDLNVDKDTRQQNTFQVVDMTTIPEKFESGYIQYNDYKKDNGKFSIKLSDEPEEIYSTTKYKFHEAPSLEYFNKLDGINSYELKEIWIKSSANDDDWSKFIYNSNDKSQNIRFTNSPRHDDLYKPEESTQYKGKYYLITENTVIRLVFEEVKKDSTEKTTFWDYEFYDTKTKRIYDSAGNRYGINNENNYDTNKTSTLILGNAYIAEGFDLYDKYKNVNKNGKSINQSAGDPNITITTIQKVKDNLGNDREIVINRTVKSNPIFGLVQDTLDANGHIQFNVNAPNLFDDGHAEGKSENLDGSLEFHRTGDTYRLYGVSGPNGYYKNTLDSFSSTQTWDKKAYYHWNSFWPLDEWNTATKYGGSIVSPQLYDQKGDPLKRLDKDTGKPIDNHGTYGSDDGNPHNMIFGMKFQVEFDLDANYTGPLRYMFYGDDDMWVFLDNKLICDIGGVHQTIGAEVDIRKALGDSLTPGRHTLSVYYLERGQSGSSCYMEYTLPNVVSKTPENATGELRLEKQSNDQDPNKNYEFEIELTDENGRQLANEYALTVYTKSDDPNTPDIIDEKRSNVTFHSKGKILLKHNQYAVVKYLPLRSKFIIREKLDSSERDFTYVSHCASKGTACDNDTSKEIKPSNGVYEISGSIGNDGTSLSQFVKVYNNKSFALPETGGVGIDPSLIASGAGIMTTTIFSIGVNKKGRSKKKKEKN